MMNTAEEAKLVAAHKRKVRSAEKKSVDRWIAVKKLALEQRMLKSGEEKHVCDRTRRKEIVDFHINDETIRDSNKPVDYSFHNLKDLTPIGCEQAGGTRLGEPPERDPNSKKFLTKALWLNNNNLESLAGLDAFADNIIDKSAGLTFIDLSYNRIKHIDVVIQQFPNLTVLYLHGNRIKEKCNLMRLTPMTKLRNVTFEGNPICGCPLYRDLSLVCMPSIVHLDHKPVTKTDRSHPVHPDIVRFLKHCTERGYETTHDKPPAEPKKAPVVAPVETKAEKPAKPKTQAKGDQKSSKATGATAGAPTGHPTETKGGKKATKRAPHDKAKPDEESEVAAKATKEQKSIAPRKANGLGEEEAPDYSQYPADIVAKANELFQAAIESTKAAVVDGCGDNKDDTVLLLNMDQNGDNDSVGVPAIPSAVDSLELIKKRRGKCACCDCRKQWQ